VIGDFNKVFPSVDQDKYVLAYEGFDPTFGKIDGDHERVLTKYGIEKPYLLYISSMYEHKNVPRLIDAFKILIEKFNYKGQLVLVGKVDKYSREIYEQIKSKGLSTRIIMPGMVNYVSDEETVVLRKNADLYVFPSLKEGFSLTPLEAQYFELPCVISDIPCHKEIYRDSVVYFDPTNINEMAGKINMVVNDNHLKDELRKKGLENIDNYSWESAAQITLKVFDGILKNA
jgi:glycosyltransferase involved in cell wall biosynthesis